MKKTDSQRITAGEYLCDTLREPEPEHSVVPLLLYSTAPMAQQARHALTATKHRRGTCPWLKRQLTCPLRRMGQGKTAMSTFCAIPLVPYNLYSWSCPLVLHSAFCSSLCPDISALVHSPQSSSLLTNLSISLMFGNPPRLLVPLPLRQQSTLLFKHLIHAVHHISERQMIIFNKLVPKREHS